MNTVAEDIFKMYRFRNIFLNRSQNKYVLAGFFIFRVPEVSPDNIDDFTKVFGYDLENGWERVRCIFKTSDIYGLHPDLLYSLHVCKSSTLLGFFLGGLISSVRSTQEYLNTQDGIKYFSVNDANIKLIRHSFLGYVKGSVKTAPLFGLFCFTFTLITSCIEVYRNKNEIIDSILGGSLTGAIFRLHYGIKGMISGGIMGSILGILYGTLVSTMIKQYGKGRMQFKFENFKNLENM